MVFMIMLNSMTPWFNWDYKVYIYAVLGAIFILLRIISNSHRIRFDAYNLVILFAGTATYFFIDLRDSEWDKLVLLTLNVSIL